jgi:NAD(P)-dependent dehydrogenase (short-subunit alcohol dehydrogenase family)
MGRVQGKVAIVTGAAKGIGAASARALAREGASVICSDFDEGAGEAMAAEIQRSGGDAIFVAHDVTDESQWENVVKVAEEKFGGLHIVVNNAGIAPAGGPIEDLTLEGWRHTIAVDLDSVFLGCKHAIRTIKKTTAKGAKGSIINISSIMGLIGWANTADYNAAKGGVRLLTKCAALECAQAGYDIRVNSIHPGYIDTPLVRNAIANGVSAEAGVGPNEMMEMLVSLHPIGRLGIADEIANMVLFLASDEASFVTGAEMVVDGGYTAR